MKFIDNIRAIGPPQSNQNGRALVERSRPECSLLIFTIRHVSTTLITSLNRRAFHIAVRTIDAAIACKWSKNFATTFAIVVELTGIGRHKVFGLMPTLRTAYRRVRLNR